MKALEFKQEKATRVEATCLTSLAWHGEIVVARCALVGANGRNQESRYEEGGCFSSDVVPDGIQASLKVVKSKLDNLTLGVFCMACQTRIPLFSAFLQDSHCLRSSFTTTKLYIYICLEMIEALVCDFQI